MISAQAACNALLQKSFEQKKLLTPLRMQKLLYLVYAHYLYKTNEPLFINNFYAWRYGPVCEVLYQEFKCYGSSEIDSYAQDAKGNRYFPDYNIESNKILKEIIDEVWNKYGNKDALDLIELLHCKGGAWDKARTNEPLDKEDIKNDVKKGLY